MTDSSIIFNRKKVKYTLLDEVLTTNLDNKTVNVIIDSRTLFDIFYIEFYHNIIPDLVKDSNNTVAELFNFIGHYHNYFRKKFSNTNVKFTIIYNSQEDNREKDGLTIWDKKKAKGLKLAYINFVLKKAKTMTKYFKNISIIDGNGIDNHLIPLVLLENEDINYKDHAIFITDDEFFFQYSKYFNSFNLLKASNSIAKVYNKNEYWKFVYEKNSYKIKEDQVLINDDITVASFLAYKGYEDIVPIVSLKSKQLITFFEKNYFANKNSYIFELAKNIDETEFNKRHAILNIEYRNEDILAEDRTLITSQVNKATKNSNNILYDLNAKSFNEVIALSFLLDI